VAKKLLLDFFCFLSYSLNSTARPRKESSRLTVQELYVFFQEERSLVTEPWDIP
jgi:hypothetical protein